MAKKVLTLIKLQIPGGQANPAPPVGPALGQHGVNIMEFCKAFNAQTAQENGRITPVEITVYEDRSFDFIAKAVRDAKAGKLEYRTDRNANVHVPIGKKSFDERRLVENYAALVDEIVRAKPAAAKGRYIRGITLATTMGPGVKVDPTKTRDLLEEAA